ncbi:MAG TPA: tagaturonate epimerase family protein [Polyangia bacterium]|nr:tagaturonate epimerase family protein [Polyangia bacterium]
MQIEKYSLGIGDRFGQEGLAQLRAVQQAEKAGVVVVPVWNKSNREHTLIGTKPDNVRAEADEAVRRGGWTHAYHVDADHIGVKTVDGFLGASDFYTLDVADFIGQRPDDGALAAFVRDMAPFKGTLRIPGVDATFEVTDAVLEKIGRSYLAAVLEAGTIYRKVAAAKGQDNFIAEVSTDEATTPQLPFELFFILGALAREKIRVQTIAPKFSGEFLKGIDYVGDVQAFARELDADLAVVKHAISVFGLPASLKISVHTGSDKFSLYPIINRALRKHGAGLHLKTAGTTWLEEVIGVALSGPSGLAVAKRIYQLSLPRFDELVKPYATVVQIDRAKLPTVAAIERWTTDDFVGRLRHDQSNPAYDRDLRQFVHVAFRVAAEMGAEWTGALEAARETAGRCVTENLFDRHVRPLFL